MNRRTFIISLGAIAAAGGLPELDFFLDMGKRLGHAKLQIFDATGRILANLICDFEGLSTIKRNVAYSFDSEILRSHAIETGNIAGAHLIGNGWSLPVELVFNTNSVVAGDEIQIHSIRGAIKQ